MSLKSPHLALFTVGLFVVMAACGDGSSSSSGYFAGEWSGSSGASGAGGSGASGNGGGSVGDAGCKRLAECCARITTDQQTACTLIISQNNGTPNGDETCDLVYPSYAPLCDMPIDEEGGAAGSAAGNGGASGEGAGVAGSPSGAGGNASNGGGSSAGNGGVAGNGGSAGGPFGGSGGSSGAPFGGNGGAAGAPFGGNGGESGGDVFGGAAGASGSDGSGGEGTGLPCATDNDCLPDGCCTANLVCGLMNPFFGICL